MAALELRLCKILAWAKQQGEVEVKRDDAARKLWAQEYRRLSEGLPGLLGAATGRAEAQVLRLSAIYAVLDSSTIVREEHLNAGLAVWDYYFESARYIFGDSIGNPDTETILKALKISRGGMTRTEIRDLFNRHRTVQQIQQALRLLSTLHLASSRHVGTDGRDTEVWSATEAT